MHQYILTYVICIRRCHLHMVYIWRISAYAYDTPHTSKQLLSAYLLHVMTDRGMIVHLKPTRWICMNHTLSVAPQLVPRTLKQHKNAKWKIKIKRYLTPTDRHCCLLLHLNGNMHDGVSAVRCTTRNTTICGALGSYLLISKINTKP